MLACFTMAYLPVTSTWFLSLNGRSDLAALVVSAVKVKPNMADSPSKKELSRALNQLFKELKTAAGLATPDATPEKSGIHLIHITPEFPIKPGPCCLNTIQAFMGTVWPPFYQYTSVFLFIDPPPPRQDSFKAHDQN